MPFLKGTTHTILWTGSTIQYSFTPWQAYSSRLFRQSRLDDEGEEYLGDQVGRSLDVGRGPDVLPLIGDEQNIGLHDVRVGKQDVEWGVEDLSQIVPFHEGVHPRSQRYADCLVGCVW